MALFELLQTSPLLAALLALVLGLLVGSFLNVVIYRLPVMMERDWKRECALLLEHEAAHSEQDKEAFNLAVPASRCPQCEQEIKPWQNIPVLSYLALGGRCGNCKVSIPWRYPAIELLTGLLSGLAVWTLGPNLVGAASLLLVWALVALCFIDLDTQLLPDAITLPLLWIGLVLNALGGAISLNDALWGAVFGYGLLWSVYWAFKLLTGKEGMGYGDFKLLAALGAWMGWQMLPLIILLSSLVGAIIGGLSIALNKHDSSQAMPFGPFLALAGVIALLWGDTLNATYLRVSGL